MASSKIAKEIHEIITATKSATIPANSSSVSVTLDIPTGYKFLSWLAVSSVGWVGYCYPITYANETATVWTSAGSSTSDRNINCWYQYYK